MIEKAEIDKLVSDNAKKEATVKDGWYVLDVTPQTSPRPRLGKFGAYMPAKYKAYTELVMYEMAKHQIKPDSYGVLRAVFYFPYSKSTPKKDLIEGSPMKKTPDWDNCGKTITDCLKKMEIIEDDNQIWDAHVKKRRTLNKEGRIEFKLEL